MILSFHPCFVADQNRLCAGRQANEKDLAAIQAAAAVILPQGCSESLYRLSRENCAHVFPNLDARFEYPGKTGQIQLFRKLDVRYPPSFVYASYDDYLEKRATTAGRPDLTFPLVLKYDWGGEGDGVFLIRCADELDQALSRTRAFEAGGQKGFILQAYLPSQNRTLRVAIIGEKTIAYWRVQKDPAVFGTSLAKGAKIERSADLDLQAQAISATRDFCRRTGINLAGFDFLFAEQPAGGQASEPYFLEINFFFGRTGLGGSAGYYQILVAQIDLWLKTLGFRLSETR